MMHPMVGFHFFCHIHCYCSTNILLPLFPRTSWGFLGKLLAHFCSPLCLPRRPIPAHFEGIIYASNTNQLKITLTNTYNNLIKYARGEQLIQIPLFLMYYHFFFCVTTYTDIYLLCLKLCVSRQSLYLSVSFQACLPRESISHRISNHCKSSTSVKVNIHSHHVLRSSHLCT